MQNVNYSNLIEQLESIKEYAQKLETRFAGELEEVHPGNAKSAANLIHYIALRHKDIRAVQRELGSLGISRLGKAESHVMAALNAVLRLLQYLRGDEECELAEADVALWQGYSILQNNSNVLFGESTEERKVRIMVTMPSEAADDYDLIYNLIDAGMNCARINCAHDGPEQWQKMINHIREASSVLHKPCKINMDLAGPKLRTGSMRQGPKVIHISPERDLKGRTVAPSTVWLAPEDALPADEKVPHVPVPEEFIKAVNKNDIITFKDTRKKECYLKVLEKGVDVLGNKRGRFAACYDSAYIETGMKLKVDNDYLTKEGKKKKKKKQDSSDIKVQTKVGEILPVEEKILLKTGDLLLLHKDDRPGEPAEYDDDGVLLKQAHISCTLPSVYSDVRAGEPILMDDGKIEGIIKAVTEEEMTIEITYAKEGGAKLKADKGINLPHSKLRIKGLTDKDREDLRFVAEYADAVNMSFVNSIDDVKDLISELNSLNAADLGVVLKIETRAGYENLPGILLSAMQRHPVGVMIARGDLAVEVGWKALADIQEKILVLCEAAHVPIVWATQVLETLAKKGRPSRAEITDAAMSQRAECVMLNKGPHIIDTVTMLNEILVEMEMHQDKRAPMLPELKVPHPFNTED